MSRSRTISKLLNSSGLIQEQYFGPISGIETVTFDQATANLTITSSDGVLHTNNIGTYFDDKIETLIGDAPEYLDSMSEMAAALGDDPTFFNNLNMQTMTTLAALIFLQDQYLANNP